MIRGGTAGAIVRLGAPGPSELDPRAEEAAAEGPLRRAGTGKGDRRALNSKRRRFLDDVEHAAERHRRTLELLCQRAGLDSSHSDAAVRLAQWLGALILHAGLPIDSATAAWGDREPLDWGAFSDPAHTLTGWVLETNPSDVEALGVACSLPDAFARRLLEDHAGGDGTGRVLDADREALDILGGLAEPVLLARSLNTRAPLTLRANPLRADRSAVLASLAEDGISARASRWTETGVIVDGNPNVQDCRAVSGGLAEVQDEGSALVVALVGALPGETIVDACAGAGGKSLALAAQVGEGTVIAADTRSDALKELSRRASRAGATIAISPIRERGPLPKRLKALMGRADRVLLDVPCSSSGAVRRRPRARRAVSDAEIAGLSRLQGEILRRFAPLVRPGGTLFAR